MRRCVKINIRIIVAVSVVLLFVNLLFPQTYLEKKEYNRIIKIYEKKDYKRSYQRFKVFPSCCTRN